MTGLSLVLNNRQKRHLKSLAHAQKPVVIVGGNGVTPAVLNEINNALNYHELIKIKINAEDRDTLGEVIDSICRHQKAELVQRLGHIATLFRRNSEKPRISLP